jgi:hypothetical protein
MSKEILDMARDDISRAEAQLKDSKLLMDKLKLAGEDTVELSRKYQEAKRRLERFKKAFG